jgi:hypothetical protein
VKRVLEPAARDDLGRTGRFPMKDTIMLGSLAYGMASGEATSRRPAHGAAKMAAGLVVNQRDSSG